MSFKTACISASPKAPFALRDLKYSSVFFGFLDISFKATNLSNAASFGLYLAFMAALVVVETSPAKGIKRPTKPDNPVITLNSSPVIVVLMISWPAT